MQKKYSKRSLKKTLKTWAKDCGFIKRERTLVALDFLSVMCFGISGMQHPSLAAMVHSLKTSMKRESLHEHFTQAAVDFMARCANFVMNLKVRSLPSIQTQLLDSFKRVLIIDSSCWGIHPLLKDLFPGCRRDATCKIQLCYEYLKGVISFFELTPEKCPDNKYSTYVPTLIKSGDLFIADLGYFKLAVLQEIRAIGAHFLSRFLAGTSIFDQQTQMPIHLHHVLKNTTVDTFDIPVLMGRAESKISCRLICMRVNEDVANKRRMKMKAKVQSRGKQGRTPDKAHLFLAGWTLMITSVPPDILPAEAIRPLYSIRWQIELVFKQLKSILNINVDTSSKPPRLQCQILGKMIMAIIIHIGHAELNNNMWNTTSHEISMEKLYKRIQERAFLIHDKMITSVTNACNYLKSELCRLMTHIKKLKQKSRMTTLQKINTIAGKSNGKFANAFS